MARLITRRFLPPALLLAAAAVARAAPDAASAATPDELWRQTARQPAYAALAAERTDQRLALWWDLDGDGRAELALAGRGAGGGLLIVAATDGRRLHARGAVALPGARHLSLDARDLTGDGVSELRLSYTVRPAPGMETVRLLVVGLERGGLVERFRGILRHEHHDGALYHYSQQHDYRSADLDGDGRPEWIETIVAYHHEATAGYARLEDSKTVTTRRYRLRDGRFEPVSEQVEAPDLAARLRLARTYLAAGRERNAQGVLEALAMDFRPTPGSALAATLSQLRERLAAETDAARAAPTVQRP